MRTRERLRAARAALVLTAIGVACLVPGEVSLSIWFFYVLYCIELLVLAPGHAPLLSSQYIDPAAASHDAGDLQLDPEIVAACEEGRFHVHAVSSVEDGIEILTGVAAGERDEDGMFPEGTIFAMTEERLEELPPVCEVS